MLIAKDEGATAGRDGEAAGGERKEAGGDGTGFATEERKAEGVAFAELKSFTTQAFFVCWRGLHLGLVQVRVFVKCFVGSWLRCFWHS